MRRAIHFLVRLYPASWRRRYSTEFAALLADMRPSLRGFFDVLTGALKMQCATWSLGRIVVLSSMVGAWIAGGGSLLVPNRYQSLALIKMSGPDSLRDVARVEAAALSRASLTAIVRYRALYPEERSKIPIEAVLQKMKRDITIRSIEARDGSVPAFSVGFAYRDRFVAQDVTQDLVVRLIDANTRSEGHTTLELLDSASLPFRPLGMDRVTVSIIGLFTGTGLGLFIALGAWLRRRQSPEATGRP